MNIVFDTNIFVSDILIQGNLLNFIFCSCNKLRYNLFLPRICYDELLKIHAEEIDKTFDTIEKENVKLSKLMWQKWLIPIKSIDREWYLSHYKSSIDYILKENKIELIDYPKLKKEEIIQRAISKKKPFHPSGSGFKDYIIWNNVIDLCKKTRKKVVFISQNKNDFGKTNELFSELKSDLRKNKIEITKLDLFNDLLQFKDKYIMPELANLISLKDFFLGKNNRAISLANIVQENLISKEKLYSLINIDTMSNYEIIIHDYKLINDVEIDDIVKLPKSNYLIFFSFKIDLDYYLKSNTETEQPIILSDCLLIQGSININKKTMESNSCEINKIDSKHLIGWYRNDHPWGILNSCNKTIYSQQSSD